MTRIDGRPIGGIQKSTGYHRATIDGVTYRTHRLAWFWVHGEWPRNDIDHIDGNPANNALSNLRDVPKAVNLQNQQRPHRNNKLGVLGVHQLGGRYRAAILVSGRMRHLGAYDTVHAAQEAYLVAKSSLHGV